MKSERFLTLTCWSFVGHNFGKRQKKPINIDLFDIWSDYWFAHRIYTHFEERHYTASLYTYIIPYCLDTVNLFIIKLRTKNNFFEPPFFMQFYRYCYFRLTIKPKLLCFKINFNTLYVLPYYFNLLVII